jgi:hypothetical protein
MLTFAFWITVPARLFDAPTCSKLALLWEPLGEEAKTVAVAV